MKKTRKEILSINPFFTKIILDIQEARYKTDLYKIGDGIILEDDKKATVLTKDLVDKLNKEELEYFENKADESPFSNNEDFNFIGNELLISSKQTSKSYLTDLAIFLEEIRKEFNQPHLIILGDWNTPWLSQKNSYPPVKKALKFLKKQINKDFNGGFLLKEQDLFDFIPNLFWLIRCNASLPYFYMTFPESKMLFSICKYGVLHLEFYDENEKMKIEEVAERLQFEKVFNCSKQSKAPIPSGISES